MTGVNRIAGRECSFPAVLRGIKMKKIIKTVRCGCCGEEVEISMTASARNPRTCFDGRPVYFPEGLIPVYQCPECFYTRYNIETKVTPAEKKYVFGTEYQSRWVGAGSLKKYYLSGAELESGKMKIYYHLVLSWIAAAEKNKAESEGYKKAVLKLYEERNENLQINEAFVCIDILRQLKEWELALNCIFEAKKTVAEIQEIMKLNPKLKTYERMLTLEEMMVSNCNPKSAYIGDNGHIEFLES